MQIDNDYIIQTILLWTICATVWLITDDRKNMPEAYRQKNGLSVKTTSLQTGQVGKLHDNRI